MLLELEFTTLLEGSLDSEVAIEELWLDVVPKELVLPVLLVDSELVVLLVVELTELEVVLSVLLVDPVELVVLLAVELTELEVDTEDDSDWLEVEELVEVLESLELVLTLELLEPMDEDDELCIGQHSAVHRISHWFAAPPAPVRLQSRSGPSPGVASKNLSVPGLTVVPSGQTSCSHSLTASMQLWRRTHSFFFPSLGSHHRSFHSCRSLVRYQVGNTAEWQFEYSGGSLPWPYLRYHQESQCQI